MQESSERPPVPGAAERARTIAARGGQAAVLPSADADSADRVRPALHHVFDNATAALLLAEDHPLVAAAWRARRGELTVMVEIADPAPVPLREQVRGLLWITGWLRALDSEAAREDAITIAAARPDPRLLDLGHGASLLRLTPVSIVVTDAESTESVSAQAFSAARPDPFCLLESGWLRHLESSHRDVVGMLGRHLPSQLRGGHVRPLGLDRFGLRLRVESASGDHDVRLAFSRPVCTPTELAAELRRLVGCPFLATTHPR